MAMALEHLTQEALQLSHRQRLTLASFLLDLEDSSDGPSVESAWDDEISARIQAVDSGFAVPVAYDQVLAKVDKILEM